ncbi:fumarylacetoacetate hydrolase family protein [Brevundimonas sp. AJA228-03]|uniref:fumarylacetoacetate hydrolase family protein n=1 Tax=Brevundimonas sp. AJA228-03 TaxID=2752515 RepID=UPI001AE0DBB7|nr:fumarylacetoacetate hydrolase family protein [Brevundimonas sp. AJA228-03]QTN18243.1 fumarylacetoacetate hydrolase family protein [Brevundimonas sp. AJA228-03]
MTLTFAPPPAVLAPTTTGERFPVRRLFCIGRNYAAHAREMGKDPDREPPFFFTSWAETVVPDGSTIAYPQATSDYQHEIELVIAIGQSGREVTEDRAMDLIYGYAIGLDMTRRDLQFMARDAGRPWDVSKNVEESKPLGPIHPAAGLDVSKGTVTLAVNGVTKQTGDLADLIWSVPEVIAHLSRFYRLEPGDLIYTGTPAGVGPVVQGDVLVGAIDGLGTLTVTIGPPAR